MCCAVLLGTISVQASETDTLIRYSEIYDTKEELPEEEMLWTDENGTVWEWKSTKLLTVPVTSRHRVLSGEIVYPGVGKETVIPEQAVLEVDDKESGQLFETSLPLYSTEYRKERWEEDLEFTVTFHSYGADVYRLGELQIPHQEGEPPLDLCREALIEAIGRKAEDCRLDKMEWSGPSYEDETGVLCRDANVTGARRQWDCCAVYQGDTELPDLIRYRKQMEYQRVSGEPDAVDAEKTEERTEIVSEPAGLSEHSDEMREKWLRMLTQGITVSISVLFLIFLILGMKKLRKKAAELDEDRKN